VTRRRSPPILLERFRPSPVYLELEAPAGPPQRRFRLRTPTTCGHFDHVDGVLVALFRHGEDLFVRIGDRAWPLDAGVRSAWQELTDDRGHFELTVGGEVVFACDYRVLIDRLEAADPGFEPGRNDLLRAVHAVIATPDRWRAIFR
jgi:hypothetical protein